MFDALLAELLAGRDVDRLRRSEAGGPGERFLQEGLPTEDAEELLRVLVGAEWAEPRADSAGDDQYRSLQPEIPATAMVSSAVDEGA